MKQGLGRVCTRPGRCCPAPGVGEGTVQPLPLSHPSLRPPLSPSIPPSIWWTKKRRSANQHGRHMCVWSSPRTSCHQAPALAFRILLIPRKASDRQGVAMKSKSKATSWQTAGWGCQAQVHGLLKPWHDQWEWQSWVRVRQKYTKDICSNVSPPK